MNKSKRQDEVRNRIRYREGREFLNFFPTKMSAREASKVIGCSTQMIEHIEKLAGWKISMRMREELNHERQ